MKEEATVHSSLRTRKKKARRTGRYFTKRRPSYRDNQNEQKGSYAQSKDGYPENNQVKPVPAQA